MRLHRAPRGCHYENGEASLTIRLQSRLVRPDQIIAEHPRLSRESVLAAIDFAAKALRADVVYPLSGHAA